MFDSVSVHRQSVGHPCYASVTCIRIATVQVRGAHRSPGMDVPVITQLMFLQYLEDVEVSQIPSSTECYRFQLYCRVVYVQCKLCKHRRCHKAVLGQVVHAPVVMLRQLLGVGQCRKTVEVPQLPLVQFLEVFGSPVVFVTTGACACPDSAENREVSARVLGLGSLPVVVQRQVPDGRDSAVNCGVSAVGASLGQGC